jgi:hypothetical protein
MMLGRLRARLLASSRVHRVLGLKPVTRGGTSRGKSSEEVAAERGNLDSSSSNLRNHLNLHRLRALDGAAGGAAVR